MIEYLQPKDGPVIAGQEHRERVFATAQPPYLPLRTLIGSAGDGPVLSRWSPTAEQRAMIQEGKDIYLELLTFHTPLQPIVMFIADDEGLDDFAKGEMGQRYEWKQKGLTEMHRKGPKVSDRVV